jgi:hypothetical protein
MDAMVAPGQFYRVPVGEHLDVEHQVHPQHREQEATASGHDRYRDSHRGRRDYRRDATLAVTSADGTGPYERTTSTTRPLEVHA